MRRAARQPADRELRDRRRATRDRAPADPSRSSPSPARTTTETPASRSSSSAPTPLPVWHTAHELPAEIGGVVLPGGFSYGDYLRCGAIARVAPVMAAVRAFAADGGPVLGICNGFQILCEAGLLPGVLRANRQLEFVCADVTVTVESTATPFTAGCTVGRGARHPDQARRGQLGRRRPPLRRGRRPRSGRAALHRRRERVARPHRRRRERGRERPRSDAASRARGRSAARPDRAACPILEGLIAAARERLAVAR